MSIVAKNTFNASMVLDSANWVATPNSWEYALNAINKSRHSKGFGLVNEEANELCSQVEGRIVGASFIDERNKTLIFTDNDELFLFDNDKCSMDFIMSAGEFGCEWNLGDCEYHYAEFKPMGKCNELHAYFSSKCTYYKVNIDEMLDETRKEAIKSCFKAEEEATSCEYSCEYFRQFKCVCNPKISPITSTKGGYGLSAGAYQFAVQLEDNDGNKTNWSWITNRVNIGSDNNIGGEASKGSISVNLSCLDCRYDKVNIAVISHVNGVQTVTIFDGKHYNDSGMEFRYYGQKGRIATLDEITVKRKTYIQGQDLIQEDGRIWLYNLKTERNLHYQPRAWDIGVEIAEYEVTAEQQRKHQYKSLVRGGRYLPAIVWQYCDNTSSAAFLLSPGGGGGSSGTGLPSSEGGEAGESGSGGAGSTASVAPVQFEDNQYCRVRGESQGDGVTGRANTNTEVEEGDGDFVTNAVDNWETDIQDYEDSTKCDDCNDCGPTEVEVTVNDEETGETICQECNTGDCSGCAEDTEAVASDGKDAESVVTGWSDELAGLGHDPVTDPVGEDCPAHTEKPKPNTSTLKQAAQKLLEYTVEGAEFLDIKKPTVSGSKGSPSATGSAGDSTQRGDQLTDCDGKNLTDEEPRLVGVHQFKTATTTNIYPDTKDCDGQPLWGSKAEQPIELCEVPGADQLPITVSYNDGVVSKFTPDNDEIGNTYIRLLGLKISNIPWPTEDELPKPLCPNQPYKIVMVPRDYVNRHVVAKGLATGTFLGGVRGATHAFPKHGVNSFEHLDRFVDEGGSRIATGGSGPGYNFHSLDTQIGQIGLNVSHVHAERNVFGNGWRHGLYAEGEKPVDALNGTKIDQRGARTSINLNNSVGLGSSYTVNGITYAPENSLVTPPEGIDYPLMNMFRESSVYFQPSGQLPGLSNNNGKDGQSDGSFVADGLTHACPANGASAWYVSLRRDLPDQYGGVEGLRFVDTGISATKQGQNGVQGICGDVYIGPHTFKRTGYVSNKVGNTHETGKGPRSICETPEDRIFQQLGQWYPTKLPINGDQGDAKNFANAHPRKLWQEAAQANAPEKDYYYPRVQKTLVVYYGEFDVNPWLRATGPESGINTGQVYYPMLKDLALDSAAPTDQPWEKSWLNRFYCRVEQPSRLALLKKALFRTVIDLLAPVAAMWGVTSLEAVPDITGYFFILPLVTAFWWFANRVLYREDRLNELLGIPECKIDDEGAEFEDCITGFEDNYYAYNWDYSSPNYENGYFSMTGQYNTCDCDDCLNGETSNEVVYSNKQVLGSELDAYSNFEANNFFELPASDGKLKKLFRFNGRFYAHTTERIFLIGYKLASLETSLGTAFLGPDLLTQPVGILEGAPEGFAGIQDPNAGIITKYGYFFVDSDARKVYKFTGQMPEELTVKGLELFAKEYLPFCEEKECRDEKDPEGVFYSMGYDPYYDRILLTKKDGTDCASWTLSYDPNANQGQGGWISFHSYIPDNYIWDRHDMYSIKGNEIWKHNKEGEYQKFYGEYEPHMIQFTAINGGQGEALKPFKYGSTVLRTEAEQAMSGDFIRDLDKSFNKVAVWNHTQGTGTLNLQAISDDFGGDEDQSIKITEEGSTILFQKENKEWHFNKILDHVKEDCKYVPLLSKECDCQVIPDINEGIFDCNADNSDEFIGKIVHDDHLTYRFTKSDGDTETRLKTIYVETHDPTT